MSDDAKKDGTRKDGHDDVMVERNHPQTRKGEPDARGSSEWRDDVVPRKGERDEGRDEPGRNVGELAEDAEATRRQAVGEGKSDSLGGDKAGGE
jgi:hypothetical protein